MAERTTLARPYARAVFDLAGKTKKARTHWSKQLGAIASVVQHPGIAPLLGNPRLETEDLAGLIIEAAGKLDEQGANLVRLLADGNRLSLAPEIASLYEDLRADAEKVVDVEVVAAKEVDEEQQKKLGEALKQRLGQDVRLSVRLDESLIGGAIIRAGDTTIDGSVRGKLARLSSALVH